MTMFEFQREGEDGEWLALGLSRAEGEGPALEGAVRSFQATWEGPLPQGCYRVREIEPGSRWRFAEVNGAGSFQLLDEPLA
jgi:hypothetical protein